MSRKYQIAISYTSEDKHIADEIATAMKKASIKVFFDDFEKSSLWGKDLYIHFSEVFKNLAEFCVILVSKHYMDKTWSKHELQAARARAIEEQEYILPILLDDTKMSNHFPNIKYLAWESESGETITKACLDKIRERNIGEEPYSSSKEKKQHQSNESTIYSLEDLLIKIGVHDAWNITRGEGVDIAIIDTGVEGSRSEFPEIKRVGGWAIESDDPWVDYNGHGTMNACISAGTKAMGGNFDGVAPDANIISCKTRFFEVELISIFDYLTDYVSNSGRRLVAIAPFGKISGTPPSLIDGDLLLAIDDAVAAGILFFFSAGNNHGLVKPWPDDDGPNTIWQHKSRADVMTISACDFSGSVYEYASRGPGQFYGEANTNIKPDVMAPIPRKSEILYGSDIKMMESGWGTSAASSIVAGIAALILSICPSLPSKQIFEIIRRTATNRASYLPTREGAGIVNCYAAIKTALTIQKNG